jgi:L-aminopeptidase/D-esterase-like protein
MIPMLSKAHQPRTSKPRGRQLGLPFPGHTGPFNAITDVPGVEVGWSRPTPLYVLNGAGEMTGLAWMSIGEGVRAVRTGVTAVLSRGRQNSWQQFAASRSSRASCPPQAPRLMR